MNSDWIFCCIVRSPNFFPQLPLCVGPFELVRSAEVHAEREKALLECAASRAIELDAHCLRAKTFFMGAPYDEVIDLGMLYARELVGLLPLVYTMASFELVRVGFVADLKAERAFPLPPTRREQQHKRLAGLMFEVDGLASEPALTLNSVLMMNPSDAGPLVAALRRSTHWQRVASAAEDIGEELLAQWMACETLCRVSETETLTPKFLSSLGFLVGKYLAQFDESFRCRMTESNEVRMWRNRLHDLFEDLRKTRNNIAHSGYRAIDLLPDFSKEDRRITAITMRMLLPRLQKLALAGIQLRLLRVEDIWKDFSRVYRFSSREIDPLTDLGNVIFSLERMSAEGRILPTYK